MTAAGRARAAAPRLKHGLFSTETVALRAALKRRRAEAEKLVAGLLARLGQRADDAMAQDANDPGHGDQP